MYLIPKNVNTRFEFKDGLGWKELGILLMGAGLGALLFYFLGLLEVGIVGQLLLSAIPILVAFFFIQVHPATRISVLDTIILQIRFTQSKKRYLYVYGGDRK